MRSKIRTSFAPALAAVLLAHATLAAQTPTKMGDVPVYPGARQVASPDPVGDADTVGSWQLSTSHAPMRLRSKAVSHYEVPATPEEVFAFYRNALVSRSAESASDSDSDHEGLSAGGATPALHDYMALDPEQTWNQHSENTRLPVLMKIGRAKLSGTNDWLQSGSFTWRVKEANGDVTVLMIGVDEDGWAPEYASYTKKTGLRIERQTYMTREAAMAAAEAAEEAEDERQTDALMKEFETAPSEAVLGVPVYPGATYDARNSASISTDGTIGYVFLSTAEPAVVATFYQTKTGKQPSKMASRIIFALQGAMPAPEHMLTVQPNRGLPGPARTIITVVRNK